MKLRPLAALLGAAAFAAGCATVPTGPAVNIRPGTGKSVEAFEKDTADCRQYAESVASGAVQVANDYAAGNAVAGSAWGAATGAIIGSATNQGGQGAAIGAGIGLLFGAISAANAANAASWELQRRYDGAYLQCMYAHGNQVPVRASYGRPGAAQVPPGAYGTYPPPNTPPPYPPQNTPAPYPPQNTPPPNTPPNTPPPRG